MTKAIVWAGREHDRYFGPFTFTKDRTRTGLAVVFASGDGDEYAGCRLRLSFLGYTLHWALPAIIKPWSYEGERKYGITFSENYLQAFYGKQNRFGDPWYADKKKNVERRWSCFLPWNEWRHVRRSMYGLDGEFFATIPERGDWSRNLDLRDRCPTRSFSFFDYDGELIQVVTRIEEREWRRGTGLFKWVDLLWPKKIRRSLDLQFSQETGHKKGSWKGGTLGHAIDMLPGELHEAAFRRYCDQHDMKFQNAVA